MQVILQKFHIFSIFLYENFIKLSNHKILNNIEKKIFEKYQLLEILIFYENRFLTSNHLRKKPLHRLLRLRSLLTHRELSENI